MGRHNAAPMIRGAFAALLVMAAATMGVAGQERAQGRHWEFLVSNGRFVPTGAQGQMLERGKLAAAQLSYVVHPTVALTATLGWNRTRDVATAGNPKLDAFTYDVGAELRGAKLTLPYAATIRPFAGAGAGARTYNYRSRAADATHNAAAYAAAGIEAGVKRVHLRVEARDYVSRFSGLDGAAARDVRNDVAILAGLRIGK